MRNKERIDATEIAKRLGIGRRWVYRIFQKRKLSRPCAVAFLSLDDACKRYGLSIDEFLNWQRQIDQHGLPGLRATKVRSYRRHGPVR
jgi:transcriptional regulator with XRE-family HTH domain